MSSLKRQEATFAAFVDQMKQIGKLFGYSPSDGPGWDIEHFGTLFTALRSLLPFQEGDRVELIRDPELPEDWTGMKHFLHQGATGVVHNIDLYQGCLSAYILFDHETWIDPKGYQHPVTEKHSLRFRLDSLRKIS